MERKGFIGIIDPRYLLSLDTVQHNAQTIKMVDVINNLQEYNFEKYSLVILESHTWEISIKYTDNLYEGMGHYHLIKCKDAIIAIPASIPIIFVFRSWGPEEFLFNYRIISLEISEKDL